jgi:hypothetical protein
MWPGPMLQLGRPPDAARSPRAGADHRHDRDAQAARTRCRRALGRGRPSSRAAGELDAANGELEAYKQERVAYEQGAVAQGKELAELRRHGAVTDRELVAQAVAGLATSKGTSTAKRGTEMSRPRDHRGRFTRSQADMLVARALGKGAAITTTTPRRRNRSRRRHRETEAGIEEAGAGAASGRPSHAPSAPSARPAQEAGLSRIYSGQHTRLDHEAGLTLGHRAAISSSTTPSCPPTTPPASSGGRCRSKAPEGGKRIRRDERAP